MKLLLVEDHKGTSAGVIFDYFEIKRVCLGLRKTMVYKLWIGEVGHYDAMYFRRDAATKMDGLPGAVNRWWWLVFETPILMAYSKGY